MTWGLLCCLIFFSTLTGTIKVTTSEKPNEAEYVKKLCDPQIKGAG